MPLKGSHYKPQVPCCVEGCDRIATRKGQWCNKHYQQLPEVKVLKGRRYDDLKKRCESLGLTCSVPGCQNVATCIIVDGLPTYCASHKHLRRSPAGRTQYQYEWRVKNRARIAELNIPCNVPGCTNLAAYKLIDGVPTVCSTHYRYQFGYKNIGKRDLREKLGDACAICGYNRVIPNLHRIAAKGKYNEENCIQLCPNHHAEVHCGLLSTDELLRYKQG